jgi:hypothetical protein
LPTRTAAWAPVAASVVLPGLGQLLQGREHGWTHLITETFLFATYGVATSAGTRHRDRYHDLAFAVARDPFSPTVRDTSFEYFEQMGKFLESGPFDTDPGPLLVPPPDERSFNGSIWALARRTFFQDPERPPPRDSPAYHAAEAFYRARAIGPNFQWSWDGAEFEQQLFRHSIEASDRAFQRGTVALGFIVANHLASAIDAFVAYRLRAAGLPIHVSAQDRRHPTGRPVTYFTLSVEF